MNYRSICEQNKYLYGLLEGITGEIMQSVANDGSIIDNSIEGLLNKKSNIMYLIEKNLDNLEKIWEAQSLVRRRIDKPSKLREPTLKERQIIISYQFNPDQSQQTIADKYRVSIGLVDTTLTKFLKKEFIGV